MSTPTTLMRQEPDQPTPDLPNSRGKNRLELEQVYRVFRRGYLSRQSCDWGVVLWIGGMHLGCLLAPFYFTWSALAVCVFMFWLTGSIGICLGYHRYLSHQSFKLRGPAHYFAILCGILSGQGTPLRWAATHRLHHARSDKDGDPHSPLDGRFWSHIMWLFASRPAAQIDVMFRRFIPDLLKDRVLMFVERIYGPILIASGVGLYLLGGMPFLVWGLFVRMTLAYHGTWFVNSATHLWGYKNYKTTDESRNLWWVAILAHGEGWHNNHHAHPHLARAGHRWWEVDTTFWVIRLMQFVRQAYNVRDKIPQKLTAN